MAKRILPYRDYSEHDVLNLFSLDTSAEAAGFAGWTEAASGDHDSGVVVKVKTGELPGDLPGGLSEHASGDELRKYLGASPTSAHIGYNAYPYNGMTVEPAGVGDVAVGITLRETLAYDENGEKLLYYKQKLDEAQAVLPGQTVPVLTRGLVLLDVSAFAAAPSIGDNLQISATDGKLEGDAAGTLGSVIAKSGSDKFLCKISF
jgi:hypothetical protein